MSDSDLSVGILLDTPSMERWAADAVTTAVREADVSIDLVVLEAGSEVGPDRPWRSYVDSAMDKGAWAPVLGWHRLVNTPAYLESVPLGNPEWTDDTRVISTRAEPADGIGQRLPTSALEEIESMGIDVLFRRGFGILQGEVLTTPTHGVVSFHHGDLREYRGRPPAVWEFAHDERYAGVTLQRLTPTLDGGEIVVEKRVAIEDCRTWQATKRRLFDASTDMLATACTRLADPTFEPTTAEELGPLYTCPGVLETVRIELKNARGLLPRRLG